MSNFTDEERWYWNGLRGLNDSALSVLHGEGYQRVGWLFTSCLFQRASGPVWVIADNGGEINVEQINQPDTLVSVAVPTRCQPLTLGYRIACVMNGRPVDYGFDYDKEMEASGDAARATAHCWPSSPESSETNGQTKSIVGARE